MSIYNLTLEGDLLRVGFGDPAQNDQLVKDVSAQCEYLTESGQLGGGPLLKINGPVSMPVAFVLSHKLAHLYGSIAVFDPKLPGTKKYVVCITHNPAYNLGELID